LALANNFQSCLWWWRQGWVWKGWRQRRDRYVLRQFKI